MTNSLMNRRDNNSSHLFQLLEEINELKYLKHLAWHTTNSKFQLIIFVATILLLFFTHSNLGASSNTVSLPTVAMAAMEFGLDLKGET